MGYYRNNIKNLTISCPQFSKEYSTKHYGAYGLTIFTYEINEPNLEPGIYNVHLHSPKQYYAGGVFDEWNADVSFQVKRNSEPNLRLKIDNIT